MDFNLTDDQRAIEDAARAFAAAELAPHSARWDEEKHFPVDVMRAAAELGRFPAGIGCLLPEGCWCIGRTRDL